MLENSISDSAWFLWRIQKTTNNYFGLDAENFHNVFNFLEISTNSKMKIRTQIFPKIDKNDLNELKHIYSGWANDNKHKK